jgi:glutamine phosphoribosylpyrophosphate amidotransferase
MRDRVRSLKRIIEVQRHLHNLEELKYVRLKQSVDQCQAEQRALTDALSGEDALHGLFTDVTVRRLKSLQQEESRLAPQLDAQARVVLAHGGRLRNSERLSEELKVELRRVEEREELERLLEAGFARAASSEQDR